MSNTVAAAKGWGGEMGVRVLSFLVHRTHAQPNPKSVDYGLAHPECFGSEHVPLGSFCADSIQFDLFLSPKPFFDGVMINAIALELIGNVTSLIAMPPSPYRMGHNTLMAVFCLSTWPCLTLSRERKGVGS